MSLADLMAQDAGVSASSGTSATASKYDTFANLDAEAEQQHGLPPGTLRALSSVESNHNPNAVNRNRNGTVDRGRFQVNSANPGVDGNDPMQVAAFVAPLYKKANGDLKLTAALYHGGPATNPTNSENTRYVNNFAKAYTAESLGAPLSGNQASQEVDTKPAALTGLAAKMFADVSATPASYATNPDAPPPESSATQNFLVGAGKGMVDTANNIKQGFDLAANSLAHAASDSPIGNAINWMGDKLGLPTAQQTLQNTNAAIAENAKYGAGATDTTAGKIGNFVGQTAVIAPTMLLPGANTLAGSAAIGGGVGLATTEGNLDQRMQGAEGGVIGGALGNIGGRVISAGATKLGDIISKNSAIQDAASIGKQAIFSTAKKYGIKVDPSDLNPSGLNSVLGGISGKVQLGQKAASENQPIINAIAKKELGINPDAPLNMEALGAIRQQAGQAYNTVRNAGTITPGQKYADALDSILKNTNGQAKSFPGLKSSEIDDVIGTLKQPTFDAGDAIDATKFLRNLSDKAYASGDKAVGSAYKQASNALEDSIGSHLQATGNIEGLANFQQARQTIAKTYSVQKAMNPATGDIDAAKLATQLNKGAPLSGGLKDIAQINNAFPKATQLLKSPYHATSPLDVATGVLGTLATGSPLGATAAFLPAGRIAVREALLSTPYQNATAALGRYHVGQDLMGGIVSPVAKSQTFADLLKAGGIVSGRDSSQP